MRERDRPVLAKRARRGGRVETGTSEVASGLSAAAVIGWMREFIVVVVVIARQGRAREGATRWGTRNERAKELNGRWCVG